MIIGVFVNSLFVFLFCFFKQKTAYEMRISDWSSDVCSSDLLAACEACPGAVACRNWSVAGHRRHDLPPPLRRGPLQPHLTARALVTPWSPFGRPEEAGPSLLLLFYCFYWMVRTPRSADGRVGKEWGRACGFWGSPLP